MMSYESMQSRIERNEVSKIWTQIKAVLDDQINTAPHLFRKIMEGGRMLVDMQSYQNQQKIQKYSNKCWRIWASRNLLGFATGNVDSSHSLDYKRISRFFRFFYAFYAFFDLRFFPRFFRFLRFLRFF